MTTAAHRRSVRRPSALAARLALAAALPLGLVAPMALTGCNTAPKAEKRDDFLVEAKAARAWFGRNVTGFDQQVEKAAGLIVFPDVGQFGILLGGGTFGRGAVYDAKGTQVGWAAIKRTSFGLQVGAEGFKMAIVLKDEETFNRFRRGNWSGDMAATAVAAKAGAAKVQDFNNGVAVYVGDQGGLMAGINIALSHVKYKSLADVR